MDFCRDAPERDDGWGARFIDLQHEAVRFLRGLTPTYSRLLDLQELAGARLVPVPVRQGEDGPVPAPSSPASLFDPPLSRTHASHHATLRLLGKVVLKFQVNDKSTFCVACDVGKFGSGSVASGFHCKACDVGRFQNSSGKVTCSPCTVCSPGSVRSAAGQVFERSARLALVPGRVL